MSRVYLAGPDVFRADARAWTEAKRATCERHGLVGVTPLDELPDGLPAAWAALPEWHRIALKCEAHIAGCDALLANLSPFRGPSADPGTVYELGYARALGKPVFGYSGDARRFDERVRAALAQGATRDAAGVWRDPDGMALEQFGLTDNLMIDGAIASCGTPVAAGPDEMAAFEVCVALAAQAMGFTHPTVGKPNSDYFACAYGHPASATDGTKSAPGIERTTS